MITKCCPYRNCRCGRFMGQYDDYSYDEYDYNYDDTSYDEADYEYDMDDGGDYEYDGEYGDDIEYDDYAYDDEGIDDGTYGDDFYYDEEYEDDFYVDDGTFFDSEDDTYDYADDYDYDIDFEDEFAYEDDYDFDAEYEAEFGDEFEDEIYATDEYDEWDSDSFFYEDEGPYDGEAVSYNSFAQGSVKASSSGSPSIFDSFLVKTLSPIAQATATRYVSSLLQSPSVPPMVKNALTPYVTGQKPIPGRQAVTGVPGSVALTSASNAQAIVKKPSLIKGISNKNLVIAGVGGITGLIILSTLFSGRRKPEGQSH